MKYDIHIFVSSSAVGSKVQNDLLLDDIKVTKEASPA